ncbi:MAG TPA: type I polyketide synthase [Bryobacteraceae bacterium]|nr:type I polyketide synthase [Bryobacteraceae bacterium]
MEPIAIIGIGCRFADATDPESFFDLLKRGVDATREVPEGRWSLRSFYSPDRRIPGKLSTNRGGFLPQIDGFDAHFFGISPREAAYMDPQQRLMLEVSWEAMEDAGLVPERLEGTDVGVFAGAFTLDYKAIQLSPLNRHLIDAHTATGTMMTMISNRLSYIFDFRGPSMSIDTACSSSLVAVHLACQSLRSGECAIALAGGVNVMSTPEYTIAESKGGFLAPDGRSKPFSAAANGYGRAEGAGVVVLKPLAAAVADRDPIYAVIRGSAVNQDGHTNGITVPSGAAQQRLVEEACRRAGVSAGEIQYVEAHGTGTPVGDPIEIGALAAALGQGRPEGNRCIIGSVKGNIGHAEAGAGVAGLIKAAMCIKHRQIPPNVHSENPNPKIPFADLPVRVPKTLESWPETGGRALAGVNSFGFGGTNAHVVIENAPLITDTTQSEHAEAEKLVVFPMSARSPQALEAVARSMRSYAQNAGDHGVRFADMVYSAASRRSHHDHRLAVVAGSSQELAMLLDAHLNGESRASVSTGTIPASGRPRLVFVCTGMGPQWWAMGRSLFANEPVFREMILRIDEVFRAQSAWSLLMEMMAEESQSRMAETLVAQTANFAIQVALSELWKSWGIKPDAVVGHSVGEVSAAYLTGALSLEDAIRVSYHRSRLQQTTAGAGAMLAVGLTGNEASKWLEPYDGRISIAAVNSPSSTTISGDPAAIENLSARLSAEKIFNRMLRVNVAYHSAQMDRLEKELLEVLDCLKPQAATIPLYSTVAGGRVDGREFDAAYWWRNVRQPVEFRRAMDSLSDEGFDCFLEVGPHPVLASSMGECLSAKGRKVGMFCSLRRGEDERSTMLAALASFYTSGMPVRWEPFLSSSASFVRLPAYPWQRERYWSESPESREDRTGAPTHPLLGARMNSARPAWELDLNAGGLDYLRDHAVRGAQVFPGAAYVEMAMAAGREVFGPQDFAVEGIRFDRALFLRSDEYAKTQLSMDPEEGSFEVNSHASSGWVRNATGRLAHMPESAPGNVDAFAIESRCSVHLDSVECYSRFAEQGFHYGPAFQKIAQIAIGDGEALARFEDLDAADAEYRIHPAVLDACFQTLVATDPFRNSNGGPSRTYMPVGIDHVTVRRRPAGAMWAWAQLERKDDTGAKGNIYLCDSEGAVAVAIEGFEVKALDQAERGQERLERSLYSVRWIPAPSEEKASRPRLEGQRWLICAGAAGVGHDLVRELEMAGTEVAVAAPGKEYGITADREFEVNPENAEHFTRLLADSGRASGAPLAGVVHCWNLDAGERGPGSTSELEQASRLGCISALHLFQAIAMTGASPRVWIVTRGAQAVRESDPVAILQSAVWGLGRVAGHQEQIGLWGGQIDLDPAARADEAQQILGEILSGSQEDQIAFRNGGRYAVRLERSADSVRRLPVRLLPDASYLLTGAFGALGLLTAKWMITHGARRLVLMSRSSVPERTRWNDPDLRPDVARRIAAIRELERMGASVIPAAVDVADENQLKEFIGNFAKAGHPSIRGVIHAAGVVEDRLMLQLDEKTFNDVLRPKAHGAWNLHSALGEAPLDFFILYSSIGSIVAATGQANYASANSFLDALAHYRRSLGLPATSINWGPWEAGMVADLNLTEHFAMRGLDVITPEQGMRFLGRLMAERATQAAVLSADWRKLFEFQPKVCAMLAHLAAEAESAGDHDGGAAAVEFLETFLLADPAEQGKLLEDHLQTLAARVLRMDRGKIDVTQSLSALGLDSMMATELKNRVELSLHIPVSVLDLLKGVSITELAASLSPRVMAEHPEIHQLLDELETSSTSTPLVEQMPIAIPGSLAAQA